MSFLKGRFFYWATIFLLFIFTFILEAKNQNHIGKNQRMLVICVKYSNRASTRLAKASDWVALLKKETNPFYKQTTYDKTTFTFETPSGLPTKGWLKLGYDNTKYDFNKTGQDAINLIDPHVDFSRYNRVLVITNWNDFGGQGCAPAWWHVDEGGEQKFKSGGKVQWYRKMSLAIVNEWLASSHGNTAFDEAAAVMAHEIGHQLDAQTHYHDFRWHPGFKRDSITPWGIMGLSPYLNHYIGWAKADRGWIPNWPSGGARVKIVGPPTKSNIDTTVTLIPQESTKSGIQLIGIPLTPLKGSPARFYGYVVENRRKINGDQHLPNTGVLVSLVDESPNVYLGRKCVVMPDPDNPQSNDASTREVGDVFTDSTHNLSIKVESQSGQNVKIRIQYKKPPVKKADPMLTPWDAPPWETKDIWIDSQKNGWGTYRYKDSSGQPVGNGDDAWVNRINRVYIRVHNIGQGDASNVRVRLHVNDPPGIGAQGNKWAYLGTIIFPSIAAGKNAENYLKWKPSVGKHTCLKAEIIDLPGELSKSNNKTQENVSHFETSAKSPYEPVELTMSVGNPFIKGETPVRYFVSNIPKGWLVELDPMKDLLPPGGDTQVRMRVYPSGTALHPIPANLSDSYQPGYIGKPRIEARVPYADTFIPIGGVDFHVHQVVRTQISLDCDPGGDRVNVSGLLQPAVGGAKIALLFTSPHQEVVKFTSTNKSGHYQGDFQLPKSADWQVRALFAGNSTYRSCKSPPCQVALDDEPGAVEPPGPRAQPALLLQIMQRNLEGILSPMTGTHLLVVQEEHPIMERETDGEGMVIISLEEGPYEIVINPERQPSAHLLVIADRERNVFIIQRPGRRGEEEVLARPGERHQVILDAERELPPIEHVKPIEPVEPIRPPDQIEIKPSKDHEEKAQLHIQVVEKLGERGITPVPGSRINIFRQGRRFAWAQTDSEGRFTFHLPLGFYELEASHKGYTPANQEINLQERQQEHIIHLESKKESFKTPTLPPRSAQKLSVHLRIMEKLRGVLKQPIPYSHVQISKNNKVIIQRSPDQQGNLHIQLAPGTYAIKISSEAHHTYNFRLKLIKDPVKKEIFLKKR